MVYYIKIELAKTVHSMTLVGSPLLGFMSHLCFWFHSDIFFNSTSIYIVLDSSTYTPCCCVLILLKLLEYRVYDLFIVLILCLGKWLVYGRRSLLLCLLNWPEDECLLVKEEFQNTHPWKSEKHTFQGVLTWLWQVCILKWESMRKFCVFHFYP